MAWRILDFLWLRWKQIALFLLLVVALLAWKEWLVFSFGLGSARTAVASAFAGLGGLSALFSLVAPKANKPIYLGLTLLSGWNYTWGCRHLLISK